MPKGAEEEVPGAVAHVPRCMSLVPACLPGRPVPLAFAAVMTDADLVEHLRRPAACVRLELVDPVPAHSLLQWQNLLKALPAVRARCTHHRGSRQMAQTPLTAMELEEAATCDPQCRIGIELAHQALEVVGLHRDIRVD